jgi:hypothetical protein
VQPSIGTRIGFPTHHTAPYPEFTSSAKSSHTARPGESTEDGAVACRLVCKPNQRLGHTVGTIPPLLPHPGIIIVVQ